MEILTNCRHATRFMEQRAARQLPFGPTWRLWVHLAFCPLCRRYAKQSRLIGQLALFAAQAPAAGEVVSADEALPAAARARIAARLAGRGREQGGR